MKIISININNSKRLGHCELRFILTTYTTEAYNTKIKWNIQKRNYFLIQVIFYLFMKNTCN